MASVVNVNISGTDELSATITRSEQAVARFGQTVNAQSSQASGAFFRLEGAAARTGVSMRNVGSAVGAVASQIGVLGPVAGLASNAIVAMATAVGPVAIAFGALTVAVGLFVYRIEQAREQMRNLSEIELAGFAREQRGLELEQDIKRRIAVLRSLTPEIEKVRQEFDKTRIELEKSGARPQALTAADQLRELEIRKVRIEQAKKEKEVTDQTRKSLIDQADALNQQLIGLELGAEAADKFKVNNLLASEAVKKLGAEGVDAVRSIDALLAGVRRFNEEQIKLKRYIDETNKSLAEEEELAKTTAEAWGFYARSIETAQQKQLDMIETERELGELSAERLQILGQDQQSEVVRLQTRIDYLQKIKALETDVNKLQLIDAQILNAQTALQKIGTFSIDIAGHVTRTIDDIFTALISRTLKAVDIGRAALATLGRIATDVFSQMIKVVIGGGGGQISLGGGTAAGAGGGGGGGILGTLGSVFQSVIGGGGGGGGGLGLVRSGIGVVGNLFGGLTSGLFGFGSAGAGVLGPTLANSGFFSTLTGAIASGVVDAIATVSTTAATAVSSTLTSLASAFSWVPFIGWAIAAITAIYRIVSNQRERPNARFSADFGVAFDEASQSFTPGFIDVSIGRKVGIKNSQAGQIQSVLQQQFGALAEKWVSILNIFPDTVNDQIIPALETTNQILNSAFQNLKFSPGGSRNIQQEIEALFGPDQAQAVFLNAFLPAIRAGVVGALGRGGISLTGNILGGITAPADAEGVDKLFETLASIADFASQLGSIPNLQRFLTGRDISGVGGLFSQALSVQDPAQLAEAFEQLKEQVKPVSDFLTQAVTQASELFGRGMMAALEAVSESDAQLAFFNSLNQGIKEAVFTGITESIISTAQFADLLAPLQQAIRTSVQDSLANSVFNSDLFNSTVLPAIESILGRAETLRPMIDALQQFGRSINQRLGLIEPEAVTEPITEGLTESALLFGNSLIIAMEAATQSEAMTNFTAAFNEGIKDALFSGIVETFLATGFVDEMLAPLRAEITRAITESQTTGEFRMPDVQSIIEGVSAAASTWEPLITFLQQFGLGIRDTLGLIPAVETPATAGPTNVVINLNGVGNVDQGSIPELARRLNFMLAPQLSPPA